MGTLLFNALALAVDVLTLRRLSQAEDPRLGATALRLLVQAAFVLGALALVMALGFGRLRLLAFVLFLHGPLLGLGTAILLRRRRPRLALTAALAGGALLAVAVDAFVIEPRWLEVTHQEIVAPGLKEPLRVALFSDFQTDRIGSYERRVLGRLKAERPDLILLSGDYLQARDEEHLERLRKEFQALVRQIGLDPPLGALAVQGDVDQKGWEQTFAGLPISPRSATTGLQVGEVQLTLLSRGDSWDPHLHVPPAQRFHIVVGHAPDYALGQIEADLLLAGHTHGGQVRLPWLGPVLTLSRVPRSWAAGRTELAGGRTLIVSRGIGMERAKAPRLRFLCRPQLVILDLIPAPPRQATEKNQEVRAAGLP